MFARSIYIVRHRSVMSLKEFIIIHNQTSFIRVEKSLSLGRIGARNCRVKFTWSKESCRARLKSKIENFIVWYNTF